jgi:hypothetical protein
MAEEVLYGSWLNGVEGGILEVEVPDETVEQQLKMYRGYRMLGGICIPEYEELLSQSNDPGA